MPYITQEERKELDREIESLLSKLMGAPQERLDGRLNYVISRLIIGLYQPSYFNYNRAVGVLASVMLEFYRRRVAPYEDRKIAEHGDI
ncbi:MAG: hypothetical protein QW756_02630 [Nitrososphaerota archaeon]